MLRISWTARRTNVSILKELDDNLEELIVQGKEDPEADLRHVGCTK